MSLEKSYELVGRILATLLLSGLRARTIAPADFGLSEGRDDLLHFVDVVNWLQREGMISAGTPLLNGTFPNAQLTARGIAAVEAESFNKAGHASVRKAVEAKPDGKLQADTYSKIGSFVGGLLGGFTQSVSGG
ncbi:MAG: hypothetical protein K5872_08745 [Rhizobiaceae bacterium]|nr:hypothetical protein [Rhizobiaceae bacterium]MCV0406302.1 hypothetical protein [Rhizobiaceae bacterium]